MWENLSALTTPISTPGNLPFHIALVNMRIFRFEYIHGYNTIITIRYQYILKLFIYEIRCKTNIRTSVWLTLNKLTIITDKTDRPNTKIGKNYGTLWLNLRLHLFNKMRDPVWVDGLDMEPYATHPLFLPGRQAPRQHGRELCQAACVIAWSR